ncbi:MAG: hypothetical protein ACT4OF_12950 [Caulobacteraceae bacterium]
MNKAAASPAELTATLVLEGAVAIVAGTVQGKAPVEPIVVQPDERAKLGLPKGGVTLFYPAGEDGVFFDMAGSTATVWYYGGDCDKALKVFEAALMRAHPKARQISDEENPLNKEMRSRAYQIELGNSRVAVLDVGYVKPGARPKKPQFAVRVFAQLRKQ